jgi:hypothetical protein
MIKLGELMNNKDLILGTIDSLLLISVSFVIWDYNYIGSLSSTLFVILVIASLLKLGYDMYKCNGSKLQLCMFLSFLVFVLITLLGNYTMPKDISAKYFLLFFVLPILIIIPIRIKRNSFSIITTYKFYFIGLLLTSIISCCLLYILDFKEEVLLFLVFMFVCEFIFIYPIISIIISALKKYINL